MLPLHTVEEVTADDDDILEHKFSNGGCCFWLPCGPAARPIWWERITNDDAKSPSYGERWWRRGWKKVREWSELVAGPKWKTFIRRFKKNHRSGNGGAKFHYDPMSYSLNFDDGPGEDDHFDDDVFSRNFSSRYASFPVSMKSSMDFGKDRPFLM